MISNPSHCMGCKNIFNKEHVTAFCKSCISRYKLKFVNVDKKIKDENQILHTKENKKKLMLDLLSRKSFNNINIEEIKIKIETDSEKKVVELNKNINSFQDYGKPDIGNLLINIMKTGADEFKEKTGRNMTYSEMRYMFG
jgi:hypothetical protein